jgi:hypothetical protein
MTDKMTPAEALAAMDIVAADLSKDGCQFTAEQIRNARATLAQQLQSQAAEVERLRAANVMLRTWHEEQIPRTKAIAERAFAAEDENERLRDLAGCAYQAMGVHDAPVQWLDALSAAASGQPFSIEGLLPYAPETVCAAEAEVERLRNDCGEAYQVIGYGMLGEPGPYTQADVERALDNLSAAVAGDPRPHDDLLPFPKRDALLAAGGES